MWKIIILSILIVALCFVLSGIFFWGLGLLIISVFNIAYTWTFMHGLCVSIVLFVLSSMFKG